MTDHPRMAWTDDEVRVLSELYPLGGGKAVLERLPHRPLAAINSKASKLGIPWTGKRLSSPFVAAILAALLKYPAGKSSSELTAMTGATESRMTKALSRLVGSKLIGSVRESSQCAKNRSRFFALEHEGPALAAHREFVARKEQSKRPPMAVVLDKQAPVQRNKVKVTICPSGKDHRFTPERVEPFFAGLGIGRYMA